MRFHLFKEVRALIISEKVFFKDTSIVFSGKVVIALLALVVTPILTRLYNPQAYGEFTLFNSIIQNMVILGTLALPSAVNVAKKEHLSKILKLAIFIIFSISILMTLGLITICNTVSEHFEYADFLRQYWYLIPIGFMVTSLALTYKSLQLRLRAFSLTTKIGVTEAFAAKGINLYNGYINLGGLGLILSDIIAKVISSVLLIYKLPKHYLGLNAFGLADLKSTLKQFEHYPMFVMPAQWVSILSTQLILWYIAFHFSANDLGKYSVALALLNIPLFILSNSFQPVITQKLVSARDGIDDQFSIKSLLIIMGLITFLVFGGLLLIPANWFVIFLGTHWQGIGIMFKILCVWYLVLFIDQSINNGFLVFDKQRQKLYLNLVDLALQVGLLTFAFIFPVALINFIAFFVVLKVIASLARIIYIKHANGYLN